MTVSIVWFRRDLRLHDHPALRQAAAAGAVVPVFIWHAGAESPWNPGAASRWWLHHSLTALDAGLRELGAPLVIRQGDARAVLQQLVRETGATAVHWNRLYEPASRARDQAVTDALQAGGVSVRGHNAALLVEPHTLATAAGQPYRVFTPFWRAAAPRVWQQQPEPAPARMAGTGAQGLRVDSLGLLPAVRWDTGLAESWSPGEDGALAALDAFCESALADYARGRDLPGRAGTSRLSPHLHFGEIGPRQVVARLASLPGGGAGAEAWLRELGWREFAHHLLYHYPHTTEQPLDPRFGRFPWRSGADADLRRWQRGETGLPIVDAGMRELWHTGWMHNRVRMIVASFLVKNLLLPWQEGARWFWDTLVDADLANNTLGWQWTAGCGADAAPYFRIFNPVLQSKRFDPQGVYLQRWLPERRGLAGDALHAPRSDALVDLAASRARALAAFSQIRLSGR